VLANVKGQEGTGVPRRGLRYLVIFLTSLSVALGGTSCEEDESEAIRAVVAELRSSYLKHDYADVCTHMSRRARREVGSLGHDISTTCPNDMRRNMSAAVLTANDLFEPELNQISLDGDKASAVATLRGAASTRMAFVKRGGRWKLDRAFASSTGPPSAAASPQSDVLNGKQKTKSLLIQDKTKPKCDPLDISGGDVTGGCPLTASGSVRMFVINIFGDRLYADCRLIYTIYARSNNQVLLTSASVLRGSGRMSGTCGDIQTCPNGHGRNGGPWTGRLTPDSNRGVELKLSTMCFDTCLGRFEGPIRFSLFETDMGRLRLRAARSPLGTSGLTITGNWSLESPSGSPRMRIRPAD
jgi:hypothetical protein